ncbi:hypothetical protein Lal_00001871 [Lupinus albus]|nr:hypothetical protein Lal_00001871 [Lupinus albus]
MEITKLILVALKMQATYNRSAQGLRVGFRRLVVISITGASLAHFEMGRKQCFCSIPLLGSSVCIT